MKALILAAGDGGRMGALTAARPKPLLEVCGRPLILRVIDALAAGGVEDVTVVLGQGAAQVRDALAGAPSGVAVRFVENDAPDLGNARSLWAARDAMSGGSFLLAMADHLIEPAMVRTTAAGANGRCRAAVERAAPGDPREDEATRALVEGGRVRALGKTLAKWNALDTGLFWCTPALLRAVTRGLRDGELSAVFASLAGQGLLDAADVTGARWLDVDTPDDLRRAQALFA